MSVTLGDIAKMIADMDTLLFQTISSYAARDMSPANMYYILGLTVDYHKRIHAPDTGAEHALSKRPVTTEELIVLRDELLKFRQRLDAVKQMR